MLKLGLHKKRSTPTNEPGTETLQDIFQLVDNSTIPISGNSLLRMAKMDATEVDECLQTLVTQDKIEIVYEKKGLDGVSRPYYRTSERYNLLDVREKVSDFMRAVIKRAKPLVTNDHNWHVDVPGRKELSTTFDRRVDARDYKRLLLESRLKLKSNITEKIFEDGLQTEERKIV